MEGEEGVALAIGAWDWRGRGTCCPDRPAAAYRSPRGVPALCDLSEANLASANFAGTDFTRANLRGSSFAGADLEGTILHVADLRGADLREARNLKAEQLAEAIIDDATWLPGHLARKDVRGLRTKEAG